MTGLRRADLRGLNAVDDDSILLSFTVGTFEPRIGEVFRIDAGEGQALESRLVEATPGSPGAARDQFSLVFQTAPGATELVQRIYPMDHDDLGSFALFLVPLGPDAGGMRYEAVFT